VLIGNGLVLQVSNSWFVNSTETFESYSQNSTKLAEDLRQWNETRQGPLVSTIVGGQIAWLRLDANSSIFSQHEDPAAGINTPHIELQIAVCMYRAVGKRKLTVFPERHWSRDSDSPGRRELHQLPSLCRFSS
jgi:hypothetical protein